MSRIFAYIIHKDGIADDTVQELVTAFKKIDSSASTTAIVLGSGSEIDMVCSSISSFFDEIWKFDNPIFSYPNAEIIRKFLISILPSDSIFLIPHCTFSMDLSPGLSVKLDSVFVPDVVEIDKIENGVANLVRQEFGGMVSVGVECSFSDGAVLSLRPGSFHASEKIDCESRIVDNSDKIGTFDSGRSFIEVIESETGDVDITKSEVLVSVGRGIEDEENIEIAEELATVLGADVSCSRPIVDAKWMDKSRQVGTSGQTVKPKVYIACGISGSFQHLGGIKGSPFMIAINKNKKAPIFQIADVGVETDMLDFIPELTDAIKNL